MVTATLPPGPRSRSPLGHGAEFVQDTVGFLRTCAREYGDIVTFRTGPQRSFLLNHPDYIEDVLVTHNHRFIKPFALRRMRLFLGDGLVSSDGEAWRRHRRLAQPAFHRDRVTAYGDVMVGYARRRIAEWHAGEVRDLHQEMMQITYEIVGKTLFDSDVGDRAGDVRTWLAIVLEHYQKLVSSFWILLPDAVPTPANLRLRKAIKHLDAAIYRVIDERQAGGSDRGDLLSMLLRGQDEDGSRLSRRHLRDEVMTLMFAGHDTTALTLTWCWYLLAQHKQVEERLHAELANVLRGRAPTVDDVPNLTYTTMVVDEVLRLYPPAWGIAREAVEDCEIGGYRIPKGSIVLMSQAVMHRDARYFDDPESFRPERWMDGLAKRLPKYAYFPFGGGQRLCIGNAFALMESALLIGTIAQSYRFALAAAHPVQMHAALTLRPRNGMPMLLHQR
ncbi:MAG: cytochrome P450 [Chloroflexi bacterium]|nr:cytochrome P450 [Chloroflexota bacterium]